MIPERVAIALCDDGWYLRQKIAVCKTNGMPEAAHDRPASAFEIVYLLAKSKHYFYDAFAVRESSTLSDAPTRNMRNWWQIVSEKTSEKAFDYDSADFVDRLNTPHLLSHDCPVHTADLNSTVPCGRCPVAYVAHFATFPRAIPRRAILAGSSEAGCCAVCKAPRIRIFQKKSKRTDDDICASREPVGWGPSCKHINAPNIPCVVLDPFLGSGTTGQVAEELGRRWVGCDLNGVYAARIANQRVAQFGLQFYTGGNK